MEKISTLAITVLMLAALTYSIAPTNATILPIIVPNTHPWVGDVGISVHFYAEISDPDELFDDPPYDWEWIFEKIEGPPEAPDEFTETKLNWGEPNWGFDKTFDYCCKYTVQIKVTNNLEYTLTWPQQIPYGTNYVVIGYDGDLRCVEPNIYEIGDAIYNCQVRFWNMDETYEVPGGWKAKVLWHGDPEIPIGSGNYMDDVPPDKFRDDFYIEIIPENRGLHWVLVVLDWDDICHESDETNNEAWALHWYWW